MNPSTAARESVPEADRHEAALQTVDLLTALISHGGWLSTSEIGQVTELHRDTVRRLCRTLCAVGWVYRETREGKDFWSIGPELPRIGLAWQRLIVRRSQQLADQANEALAPFVAERS